MDFIELNKCEGKKHCLVIIDMFTKWVEVFPSASPDAKTAAKALVKEIIPRFGIPERIYSDHLNSTESKNTYKELLCVSSSISRPSRKT